MKKRDKIFIKYNGLCGYTGTPLESDWQIDHMHPISRKLHKKILYKINDDVNLIPCQRIINHYKRAQTLEEFRRFIKDMHLRLKKLPKKTKVPSTLKRKEYLYKVASYFNITIDKPFNGIFYFETIKNEKEQDLIN